MSDFEKFAFSGILKRDMVNIQLEEIMIEGTVLMHTEKNW